MKSLKSLFNISSGATTPTANITQNDEARRTGETYKEYGERLAARSNANNYVLQPTLQSVYLSIKKEQQANDILQQQLRQKQQVEVNNTDAQKKIQENNLGASQIKCNDLNNKINSCEKEIQELKISAKERNQKSRIHLIISGLLLVPFTIYLFIFYSNVAYSALFNNLSSASVNVDELLNYAIFNAKAISNSWQDGVMTFMFIMLMPIIFLAFGYDLHCFEQQEGKIKYFKICGIIIVAFIFDALFAYAISKKIYDIIVMAGGLEDDAPPFSIGLAFCSTDFWTVICLGFVSYLIWGITFGFFMNALESLDMKRIQIDSLNSKIQVYQTELKQENDKIKRLSNTIVELDAKIKNLQLEMVNSVLFDRTVIKLELNNFIKGWQSYMGFAGKPDGEKAEAKTIFDSFITSIDSNSSVTAVANTAT